MVAIHWHSPKLATFRYQRRFAGASHDPLRLDITAHCTTTARASAASSATLKQIIPDEVDYLVIGSGVGGLCAASLLCRCAATQARAGRRTLCTLSACCYKVCVLPARMLEFPLVACVSSCAQHLELCTASASSTCGM
jgi:hypothetical protein